MSTAVPSADLKTSRARRDSLWWAAWSIVAAFGTYFCMYGFRKPFTAATYGDAAFWSIDLKTILVVSQVAGYTLSKFIGIKVISEMPPQRRALAIFSLVAFAELSLVAFGQTPHPWSAIFLFLNGLPLGMVFGLVLGFLEGRRTTELLTACLCASFILADGATKSIGSWLLQQGTTDTWMPAAAGLIYFLPLCLFTWMLSRIPAPDADDIALRSERVIMNHADRKGLVSRYAFGLTLLVVVYLLVTVIRSVRSDFAPEIWKGLGEPTPPAIYTWSEMYVALGILLVNGSVVLIRNNRIAFFVALGTCVVGFGLILAALLGHQAGVTSPFAFMVMIGLGAYLPYVAIHTTVFERLLAYTRERGNLGFLMYIADAFGYLGYVAVMIGRHFIDSDTPFAEQFTKICLVSSLLSLICIVSVWRYFAGRQSVSSAPVLQPE